MDFDVSKNYYDVLGVDEKASADEIKKAFKKAAVQHHPDKAGGDKKKFQEANEAYQVIGDEKKKAQYDAYRSGGYTWGGQGWFGWWDFGWGGFWGFGWGQGGVDFWDFDIGDLMGGIFGGGFGGGGRQRKNTNWEDITIGLTITFEEGFVGTTKKFSYEKLKKEPGTIETICDHCRGRGAVSQQVQTPFGVMQSQVACRNCGWIGKIYTKDGRTLPAWGLHKDKEILEVKIPAGIKDGAYIKYTNKWNDGTSGKAGDLYVQITVANSRLYERKGDNLYVKTSVTIYDVVLWGECSVDHPEGKLKVKIPKGTQIGDMIKISGKWFGEGGIFSKKWDLYVIPKIEIPKKLSKEQEKLWSELKGKK